MKPVEGDADIEENLSKQEDHKVQVKFLVHRLKFIVKQESLTNFHLVKYFPRFNHANDVISCLLLQLLFTSSTGRLRSLSNGMTS